MRGTDETKPKMLPLESIRTDGGTQTRASLNQQTIEDYADDMRDGASFPPVVVFFDGTNYWLADGFHRWYAARKADLEKLSCDVKQGTQRDAILYSVGANSDHGQRRTNADKRRAVEMLLADEEWSKKSAVWIAEKCGVGNRFVTTMKNEACTVQASTVTGRDGKQYPRKRAPAVVHEIPSDLDDVQWEPASNGQPVTEEESDEAPVTGIPKRSRRATSETELSDLGKVAMSIEAQIGLLIQECEERKPEDHKAFDFGEGVKQLRFAKKIICTVKSIL